jgi:predicted subunit of tRNA(5-methylaminomethyl-2-thiouridylate) methyltransferase
MDPDGHVNFGFPNDPGDAVAVLFSGGRDSSLVAALLARDGWKVHLITCDNGISMGGEVIQYRLNELKSRFPESFATHAILPSYGLFRHLALAAIEDDFAKYKKNLIILGSQLATHATAAVYCLEHGITRLASGFARYQLHLPEQKEEAAKLLRSFLDEFGIAYAMPVYEYANEDAVKYKLFEFGISTKSLESTSVFSDTSSEPSGELVAAYVADKLPLCRAHVNEMTRHLAARKAKGAR